jgi:sugar O-acyltransferase (sialic acid O-acetyltransferase NeuD family)
MASETNIQNLILGGGGHAKVLIDSIQASGSIDGFGILDSDPDLWGTKVLGVPVLGTDEMIGELVSQGAQNFIVGLGSVGDNGPRRRLYELGLEHGLSPLDIRHPSAVCSTFASIQPGTLVGPGAVINADAEVRANVILNTGTIVEHDCVIGDHVHVSSGATLAAAVRVGLLAHIGAGATVRQGIRIGEGAIVGAGAVVVRDVASWTVVVGVPAQVLKRVENEESAYAATERRARS